MKDQYWRSGDGFICVFAIDDFRSFEQVDHYITKLRQVKSAKYNPMVLVGNKADLEKRRAVENALASEYAKNKCMPFIETSAKTGVNVKEAFATIVCEIDYCKTKQCVGRCFWEWVQQVLAIY